MYCTVTGRLEPAALGSEEALAVDMHSGFCARIRLVAPQLSLIASHWQKLILLGIFIFTPLRSFDWLLFEVCRFFDSRALGSFYPTRF